MWAFNHARTWRGADGKQKTPFEALWQQPYKGVLAPFGCKVLYLTLPEHRDKFDTRARVGIYLGHRQGGIEVMDAEAFEKEGAVNITISRDFTLHRDEFPFEAMNLPDSDWDLSEILVGFEPEEVSTEWYMDRHGKKRCQRCNLLVAEGLPPVDAHARRCLPFF